MVQIAQFDGGFLDVRVVRAYAKSKDVRDQTGILVDFSAKMVLVTANKKAKSEKLLMALNDLHIRVDRNGHLRLGSQVREYKDAKGFNQRVWPVSFFPFNGDEEKTEDQLAEEDKFIDALMDEINEFIVQRRGEAEERKNEPRKIPLNNPKVAKLAGLGDQANASGKNGKKEEDTPF